MMPARYGPVSDAMAKIIGGRSTTAAQTAAVNKKGFNQVAKPSPGQGMPKAVAKVTKPGKKTKAPKSTAQPKRPKKKLVGAKNAVKNTANAEGAPLATPLNGVTGQSQSAIGPTPGDIHVHLHMGMGR